MSVGTLEVFTVGGGDYLVLTFNAVASLTTTGGYAGFLKVITVMAFAMAVLRVALTGAWKPWLDWFIQIQLMILCVMVPRVDIQVTDRLNPTLAAANIANVPIGLGVLASVTSQIGDYLTRASEVVFALPNDLDYSRNGMIYGSRLLESTRQLRLDDAEFAANLDAHFRQCVFYDIMLGKYALGDLAQSTDIWAFIEAGGPSPARSQPYLAKDPGGAVTSTIVTCADAFAQLKTQWAAAVDRLAGGWGSRLYPNLAADTAKAKLLADLPIVYQYLTDRSASAVQLIQQSLVINHMNQAMTTFQAATGSGAVDAYAATRAEIQTEKTYQSIARQAEKWVPLLRIVLECVFYGLFPVIFPLFLFPVTGPVALKGYIVGFFYLQAWGPIYVIIHMIVSWQAATQLGGVELTALNFAGIGDVNNDTSTLAGYLLMSVPFIAAGLARGAMAISGNATSILAPSQSAASEAAREAATGNISLGNTGLGNHQWQNVQANQWTTAASYAGGAPRVNVRDGSGGELNVFPDAFQIDNRGRMHTLGTDFNLGHQVSEAARQNASTSLQRASNLVNSAYDKLDHVKAQAADLFRGYNSAEDFARDHGLNWSHAQTQAINREHFAGNTTEAGVTGTQTTTGSRGSGGRIGLTGGASGEVGIPSLSPISGKIKGGAEVGGSANAQFSNERRLATSGGTTDRTGENLADRADYAEAYASALNEVASLKSGRFENFKAGASSTLSDALGLSRNAEDSYNEARRFERAAEISEALSTSGQTYLGHIAHDIAQEEIARNSFFGPLAGNRFDMFLLTGGPNDDLKLALRERVAERLAERLGVDRELQESLVPTRAGLSGPAIAPDADRSVVTAQAQAAEAGLAAEGAALYDPAQTASVRNRAERNEAAVDAAHERLRGQMSAQGERVEATADDRVEAAEEMRQRDMWGVLRGSAQPDRPN